MARAARSERSSTEAGGPILVEPIDDRRPAGRARCWCGSRRAGCATATSGRSSNGNWGHAVPDAARPRRSRHRRARSATACRRCAPGDRVVLSWAVPCGTVPPVPARRAPPVRARAGPSLRGSIAPATAQRSPGVLSLRHARHPYGGARTPGDPRCPTAIPLSRACLLGCGVSTGVGAAIQTAEVWPGASVAVIGLGGIGLSALQGARIAGATRLIAVDVAPAKLGVGCPVRGHRRRRCLHRPMRSRRSVSSTGGEGVDVAFEAVGVPGVRRARRSRCSAMPARRWRSACRRSRATSRCLERLRRRRLSATRRAC